MVTVATTTKQAMKSFSTFQEDLRNWFNPNHPDGNWKRVNTKGEVVGDCAREPGEPKPKCMSQSQRDSLSKKEKANAVRRKRKADPNPERQGEPINVTSKVNENMEHLDEKNEPTNPELWARAIAQAKSKFDVYPSAYANGWASKWYKQRGGGWKTVSEAKEKTEYDYEGDMARGQLQSIISNAQRVHDMLEDNDNIAEWVQSKITLAEDYISTVANYMMSEVDEQFNATRHTIEKDSPPSKDKVDSANKQYADMAASRKKKLPQGADFAAQRRKERLASNGRMDEESIDELSSDLLGRYKTGASKQASELDKAGNIKKADSRFSGIVKATKKQFANDLKKQDVTESSGQILSKGTTVTVTHKGKQVKGKIVRYDAGKGGYSSAYVVDIGEYESIMVPVSKIKQAMNETLEEGRPSQRHPLEGHDYHKKTDAELVYIAKDAHKAADAMKSHNTDAENKYRDQANDSATVRYFRQKNGMPDWYKKKYGHVKESVEVLDGEEMQASEIIDNIQESRKKAIVREALKDAKERMEKKGKKEEKKDAMGGKGDKFEAEPQMTSLVNDKQ